MIRSVILVILILLLNFQLAFAEIKNDVVVKFAHLADIQLDYSGNDTSRRLFKDSPQLFADAISQVNNVKDLDFVIITGDMIDSASENTQLKFLQLADKFKAPWYPVLGNHDVAVGSSYNKNRLVQILKDKTRGMKNGLPYYTFSPNAKTLVIVLDGTNDKKVSVHGHFNAGQLNWLRQQLEANKNKLVIIALHFPPVPPTKSSTHFIVEPDRTNLMNIINKYNNIALVISGHYHTAKLSQPQRVIHDSGPALIEYPNAFRIVTIKENGDVIFDWYETSLKALQQKSKKRCPWAATAYGTPKDRSAILNWKQKKSK